MTEEEFKQLVKDKKSITSNIVFEQDRTNPKTLVCKDVEVQNTLGHELYLDASYKKELGTVKYNFKVKKQGPICRVCINGPDHGDAGRNHKHELTKHEDSARNLPFAINRDDLDGKTAREIFTDLCARANIDFQGSFQDPEESNEK